MFCKVRPLCVVALLFCVGGCQSRSVTIHYVLPDGFRGAVLIYPNQPDGIALKSKDGRYTCIIPENGILRITGDGPFYQWHSISAAFANGQVIPVANEPERLAADTVAFWSHGSCGGGMEPACVYDFIGTKGENTAFSKATASGPIIAGSCKGAESKAIKE